MTPSGRSPRQDMRVKGVSEVSLFGGAVVLFTCGTNSYVSENPIYNIIHPVTPENCSDVK